VNLTAPSEVAALLRRHGLRPRKRWGQNFLIDRNTLDNVLRAEDVDPEDAVLAIGLSALATFRTRDLHAQLPTRFPTTERLVPPSGRNRHQHT
jgi:hypothetical protein